jgi:hypothetical protein
VGIQRVILYDWIINQLLGRGVVHVSQNFSPSVLLSHSHSYSLFLDFVIHFLFSFSNYSIYQIPRALGNIPILIQQMEWGPRFYISNQLPGDAQVASPSDQVLHRKTLSQHFQTRDCIKIPQKVFKTDL